MPTRVMNKGGVVDGGFVRGINEIYGGDEIFFMGKKVMFKDVRKEEEQEEVEEVGKNGLLKNSCKNICTSDESSSIGKNSDLSENSLEKLDDGEEVQSSYKGPLDAMEALEEVLPIRISRCLLCVLTGECFADYKCGFVFTIKDLGDARYFLGIEIARGDAGTVLSQRKYVLDILESTGFLGSKAALTPLPPGSALSQGSEALLSDPESYRRLVG